MYDPEMRKDCPMRGNLGNCSPVGGFCINGVSDEICEAVHNAYYHGFYNALKEQKTMEPLTYYDLFICPVCKNTLFKGQKFCYECGEHLEWGSR